MTLWKSRMVSGGCRRPTEGALLLLPNSRADSGGFGCRDWTRFPLRSQFQYMATLHQTDLNKTIYVKGSVETILNRCQQCWMLKGSLSCEPRTNRAGVNNLAKQGLRVLAFAKEACNLPGLVRSSRHRNRIFLGFKA